MYAPLKATEELKVRKNALMVLTHLILNDMIKIKEALGDEGQWAVIMTEAEVAARAKTVARTAGTVLEKQGAEGAAELARPGPDGRLTYPLSCLVSSVAWPEGVDPTQRELWLWDEEFAQLFGMDKAAWLKTPVWKRAGARKKHDLF